MNTRPLVLFAPGAGALASVRALRAAGRTQAQVDAEVMAAIAAFVTRHA